MDRFNKEDDFFDFIFTPNKIGDGRYIFCKKRKWLSYSDVFRTFQLINWVARDYLKEIYRLSLSYNRITIVVFDDVILLEAIALKKKEFKCEIILVFYFHGFQLLLSKDIQDRIDKVLFLSRLSYLSSLKSDLQFTPEAVIVGNGIDSNSFYPLDIPQKNKIKEGLELPVDSWVVTWMANDRPVKGLHLFLKVVERILETYPKIQVQIIGADPLPGINHPRIMQRGKVPHKSIPEFLQASDFYFFTSLWKEGFGLSVVEAAKCGNWIVSSNNGSIVEVLEGFDHVYFVDFPNILNEWIEIADRAIQDFIMLKDKPIIHQHDHLHSYESWKVKFTQALI
jgi:glycosyltransferase involved in cell wall biosynthesis